MEDVFTSCNRDNVTRSPNGLKQIAYESRAKDRLDISELDSLMQLQLKYCAEDKKNENVCGFVHLISVNPVIIFMWTREFVKMFYDLCQLDAVFWDAT